MGCYGASRDYVVKMYEFCGKSINYYCGFVTNRRPVKMFYVEQYSYFRKNVPRGTFPAVSGIA
jgi:hypothetical protein